MTLPVYAVIGHPNEGKSSVVATLAEDDSVRISAHPGETLVCQTFGLSVDGQVRMELVDTPGFQHPQGLLARLRAYNGPEEGAVTALMAGLRDDPAWAQDLELLTPLARHAGLLYVVDASRPVREDDRAEMEILRLLGLPRMAILNAKHQDSDYADAWKAVLSRTFNLVWTFNAHHASFEERLALLEAMKALDQERAAGLESVIRALRQDWQARLEAVGLEVEHLLTQATLHAVRRPVDAERLEAETLDRDLEADYLGGLRRLEREAHARIRRIFHHLRLRQDLDAHALVVEDLFSATVWKFLGLNRSQLTWSAAVTGGLLGVGADLALGGLTFGVLTAGGALAGGLGSWLGGSRLSRMRLPLPGPFRGLRLGRISRELGPCRNPQLLFVLLDRSLIYTRRVMNWTHARRDDDAFDTGLDEEASRVRDWSAEDRKAVLKLFAGLRRDQEKLVAAGGAGLRQAVVRALGG